MWRRLLLSVMLCAFAVGIAGAHDMFLVATDHDVAAKAEIEVALFNGTFDKSENTIARERMIDVSVVDATGDVVHPSADAWRDDGDTSLLRLRTGSPGTLLIGVSTRPRMIELSAADFNEYLRHDGVLDVLAARESEGSLDRPTNERYSKHVKILLTVSGESSETWQHRLGYPIEFVPLSDPSGLAAGDTLEALVLADGEPLAGHLVHASYAGFGEGGDGAHREAISTRTDEDGVARVELSQAGRWYLRIIHMTPSTEEGVDYVSNWATLTFAVR